MRQESLSDYLEERSDPLCFSPRTIADFFAIGIGPFQAHHLTNCRTCAQRAESYARIPQRQPTREAIESKRITDRLRRHFGKPKTERRTSILISLPGPGIMIPTGQKTAVSFNVVAPHDFLEQVDARSLELSGALRAASGQIISGRICFAECDPSEQVRNILRRHYGTFDNVRVTGSYKDSARPPFMGQLDINFRRA